MMLTDGAGTDVMVSAEELTDVITRVLVQEGATAEDARHQAAILVEADLRAQHSHGVQRLPVLVGRLRAGLIRSGYEVVTEWAGSALLRVDGGRGFGPAVARHALSAITQRAVSTGVALAAIRNSNHVGMLAPYVESIAHGGQIGLAFTTSEALVHPWGGARALVGTNPIGIAVPTGDVPLVLDMSTAAVSMGKVLSHLAEGEPIPPGWAVDVAGVPTTDAEAATRGALSPFGGAKGYALGLALEAMIGVLTSTAFGTDVKGTLDTEHVATKGDVFVAISPESVDLPAIQDRLTGYLDELRASGGSERPVTVPGDRARTVRQERLDGGIPLPAHAWRRAVELLRGGSDDER